MATSFVNFPPSEEPPMVANDYQDLSSIHEGQKHQHRALPPPKPSSSGRACPTRRLHLLLLVLCGLLTLLVAVFGIQEVRLGAEEHKTREGLVSFNWTALGALGSLQNKSTDRRLEALDVSLKDLVLEVEKVKNRLQSQIGIMEKEELKLRCQLIEMKSNGTKSGCCPKGWRAFHKSCYWLSQTTQPWEDANRNCESKNAHMLIINSQEERDFINRYRGTYNMWLGLTDTSGSWKWVDGSSYTVNPADWDVGQPDHWYGHGLGGGEDCVQVYASGLWNDNHCSRAFRWMCEQELQD